MRVAIQTLGTRGDVQPYLALARGLTASGHEPQLAAPAQFASLIESAGVPFAALPGEFLDLLDAPEGKRAVAGGGGFGAGLRLIKHVRPMMRRLFAAEWEAVRSFEPDLIVYHPKSIATPHIAEKLGLATILASPLPGFTPTAAFPSPLLPFADLGPLNRLSHTLAIRGAELIYMREIAAWRTETLGLPGSMASAKRPAGTIYAYSPAVLPKPPDWDERVLVSGYWFLPSDAWAPDDDLAAYLAAGEPPIYIGFGSMPGLDPLHMTRTCIEAASIAGKRILLATGGGALAPTVDTPSVRTIAQAPHDRLFQYVSATVHHGGAGTTGAALRAGKPTVACPFFGDQPFWARRIVDLGVGPPALDRKRLTPQSLAQSMLAMDDTRMRAQAQAIGARIRSEDGVAAALAFVDKIASPARHTT
jgi:UDP:flavonoid glycosyltransferase YjiC (YdhE family)